MSVIEENHIGEYFDSQIEGERIMQQKNTLLKMLKLRDKIQSKED